MLEELWVFISDVVEIVGYDFGDDVFKEKMMDFVVDVEVEVRMV